MFQRLWQDAYVKGLGALTVDEIQNLFYKSEYYLILLYTSFILYIYVWLIFQEVFSRLYLSLWCILRRSNSKKIMSSKCPKIEDPGAPWSKLAVVEELLLKTLTLHVTSIKERKKKTEHTSATRAFIHSSDICLPKCLSASAQQFVVYFKAFESHCELIGYIHL